MARMGGVTNRISMQRKNFYKVVTGINVQQLLLMIHINVGCMWRIGRVDTFRPKGHGFDSHCSRHVGTLGKTFTHEECQERGGVTFTHSCLWRFSVKFRLSIHAVSGSPLSSSGLEEAL